MAVRQALGLVLGAVSFAARCLAAVGSSTRPRSVNLWKKARTGLPSSESVWPGLRMTLRPPESAGVPR